MQLRQIVGAERMLFDCHIVQPCGARRIITPGLPGGEKVDADTEAGFNDGEDGPAGPARRQIIAAEKHMPRLTGARISAVIDVAIGRRVRRARGIEGKRGGFECDHCSCNVLDVWDGGGWLFVFVELRQFLRRVIPHRF